MAAKTPGEDREVAMEWIIEETEQIVGEGDTPLGIDRLDNYNARLRRKCIEEDLDNLP